MFDKFKRPSKFDGTEDKLIEELMIHDPDSREFNNAMAHLERIKSLQETETRRISPDTMAIVAGNLLGILIMVGYERAHVMTSKSLSMLLRTNLNS